MERIRKFSFRRKSRNSQPYILISDFENVTEKDCIKYDRINQDNYNNLLLKAKQAQYTIRNSGLSMNLEVPMPPRPCNRDRLILWRKRNVSKPVIDQSNAIVFLNENGYILNQHYEAYQAIDLANELKRKKGIKSNYKDVSKDFNDIYTKKDKNILRRRSMYNVEKIGHSNVDNFGFRNELQHAHGINNLYDLENNSSVKLRNPIRRRNVETINFDEYEQSLQQHNSDFKCSNDESKTNDILINTFPCPPSAPPILPSIQQTVPPAPPAPTAPNSSNNEEIKDELNLEKPSLENIDFNKRTSLYPSL
tara:strand:+ start:263 stop:1183 length:921 start_codon:yes stop_codon:yes gene_type:complete